MNLFNSNYFLKIFPFLSTFFCFLLMTLPIMPKGMGEITPMFGVIVLSFWIIFRQDLLPYYSVFILGLFHDAMIGTLFGSGSLALILIKFVVVGVVDQDHRVSFLRAFFIIILCLLLWTVIIATPVLIKYSLSINFIPIVFQLLSSIIIVPIAIIFMSFFLNKMDRSV